MDSCNHGSYLMLSYIRVCSKGCHEQTKPLKVKTVPSTWNYIISLLPLKDFFYMQRAFPHLFKKVKIFEAPVMNLIVW